MKIFLAMLFTAASLTAATIDVAHAAMHCTQRCERSNITGEVTCYTDCN